MTDGSEQPDRSDPPSARRRGRVLGLDLGDRRIGVAVCDTDRVMATPYGTVKRVGNRPVEHAEIQDLVNETSSTLVVVGLPLSLDGSTGPAARSIQGEVRALNRALSVPVETHDERMTTITAETNLAGGGVRGRKQRAVVDQVAASIILQSWLDRAR